MTRTDPLDRLRAANPVPDPPPGSTRALRDQLRADDARPHLPARKDKPTTHRRRLLLGAVLAAATLATSTAAAVVYLDPRDTTETTCEVGADLSFGIPARTGDPVADCTAAWESETGRPAPAGLVAYASGHGQISVFPPGLRPPAGYTRLPAGPVQDPEVLELGDELSDWVDGLEASCYTDAEGMSVARRTLAGLGLTGWRVVDEPEEEGPQRADGETTCLREGWTDVAARTIHLRPERGGGRKQPSEPEAPWRRLPAEIREALATCLTLPGATADITRRAAGVGAPVRSGHVTITEITDPGATCTRADMEVGGLVMITLRGPRTAR